MRSPGHHRSNCFGARVRLGETRTFAARRSPLNTSTLSTVARVAVCWDDDGPLTVLGSVRRSHWPQPRTCCLPAHLPVLSIKFAQEATALINLIPAEHPGHSRARILTITLFVVTWMHSFFTLSVLPSSTAHCKGGTKRRGTEQAAGSLS